MVASGLKFETMTRIDNRYNVVVHTNVQAFRYYRYSYNNAFMYNRVDTILAGPAHRSIYKLLQTRKNNDDK